MKRFLSSWFDFYPNPIGNQIQKGNHNYRFLSSNATNLYFTDLEFIGITNPSQAGALYFSDTSNSYKILIEKTLFAQCQTTKSGVIVGAIYFSYSGYFIFYQICGTECLTSGNGDIRGQFCFCTTNANSQLSLFSSSIVNCIYSDCSSTLCLYYGTQNIKKINSSHHHMRFFSGILSSNIGLSLGISIIKHSTFENNIDTSYGCLW
jgi:hypothetical protein